MDCGETCRFVNTDWRMKMEAKLNTGAWSVVDKNKFHGYYIESEAGETVCDLYFKTSLNEICEHGFMTKENAHLIAAAPEMYEMLEEIASHIDCGDGYRLESDEIKTLLAKARGE